MGCRRHEEKRQEARRLPDRQVCSQGTEKAQDEAEIALRTSGGLGGSENVVARRLWEKLGFKALGVIPDAVRKNDGTYQDATIMFRSLLER